MIIGLGNPGREYEHTRHNAGFWFVDRIAAKHQVTLSAQSKFWSMLGKFTSQGQEVFLLKPQTFMNLSGKAVSAVMSFFKITATEILVVHDELDFPVGIAKFKQGGGNGGHNGLKDIERVIGKSFWRLRIGIDHPGDKNKVVDYVLKRPDRDEMIDIDNSIDRAMDALDLVFAGELNSAMKQLHS